MKKIIIIALLLNTLTTTLSAQFAFGIKAGYNASLGFDENWNLNGQTIATSRGNSNGYNIGIMTRTGNRYFVQIEGLFSQKFSTYTLSEELNQSKTAKVKQQTIDMPILAGYKLIDTRNFSWRIMAGPTFSFNTGSKTQLNATQVNVDMRDYEIGMDLGTGMDIAFITIDLRYKLIQNNLRFEDDNKKKLNSNPVNAFELSFGWKLYDSTRKKNNYRY